MTTLCETRARTQVLEAFQDSIRLQSLLERAINCWFLRTRSASPAPAPAPAPAPPAVPGCDDAAWAVALDGLRGELAYFERLMGGRCLEGAPEITLLDCQLLPQVRGVDLP
jgi:hypothetical protein